MNKAHRDKSHMPGELPRRHFLAGLGALTLLKGCPSPAPDESPTYRGPFRVARAILGVTPSTNAMPLPDTFPNKDFTETQGVCGGAFQVSFSVPAQIQVSVYYPAVNGSDSPSVPIQVDPTSGKKYPIVLYAHAKRMPVCPANFPQVKDASLFDIKQDFTHVGFLLSHLASHGCVVAAPDLSWLTGIEDADDWGSISSGRAQILVALYQYLLLLNAALFFKRMDLSKLLLMGHSSGGAACLIARAHLIAAGAPVPVAMGLLAPATTNVVSGLAAQAPPILVLKGTNDYSQGANPDQVFQAAGAPKALVTVPGANHYGYTEICSADNTACAADDPPGTIPRVGQQLTGAAYLAALMRRFALNDTTVQPYLNGQRAMEVATWGVNGVQVTQQGM